MKMNTYDTYFTEIGEGQQKLLTKELEKYPKFFPRFPQAPR